MSSRNRGVKKPKLRDLSNEVLTSEEWNALLDAVDHSLPPIALAILGQILVEHELDKSLRRRIPRKDDKTWAAMLDERGPLSTFSRKIAAAHALQIIDDATKTNMDIIRVIRNAFAHSRKLIDFDHTLVVAELARISIPGTRKRTFSKLRAEPLKKHAYVMLCMVTTTEIIARRNKSHKATQSRKAKTSPLYRALAPSLGLSSLPAPFDPKLNRLLYPQSHIDGPSPPTPQGLMGGLFGLGEHSMSLRNLGKKK